MNSMDLLKILASVFLMVVLTVITGYIEIWFVKDPLQIILLEEVVKLLPVILLSTKLGGILIISSVSGLTFGLIENAMRVTTAPEFILLHLITVLISGISTYPLKRSKNYLFTLIILLGIFTSFLIHYYANWYSGNLFFGLSSIFYAFN